MERGLRIAAVSRRLHLLARRPGLVGLEPPEHVLVHLHEEEVSGYRALLDTMLIADALPLDMLAASAVQTLSTSASGKSTLLDVLTALEEVVP